MKRLGFLCFFVAITFGLITINPTNFVAHAQTSTGTPEATKSQLQAKADTLFANFIAQLQAKQNNPRQIPSLSSASDADIAKYVEGNKQLIAVIGAGKSVFTELFTNPAAPSTNIYADFTAALNAASSKINEGQRTIESIRTNSLLRAEVTVISSQINTLAQERQEQLKEEGNGDGALKIQNAAGVQRTEQAKKELAGEKCKIMSFSLVECVDVLLTWIIKNTLLQIAGFLVWLTANMLNFAIQISVLDFAKWAPDSLYPIWIVIRQIVSLVVVFAGLYLGFMYIIGREDTFGKYVGWLVLFALFVNFSYPITRTLVDISNIVSLNVYTSAVGTDPLTTDFSSAATTLGGNTAGALIMNRLGLQGLVSAATNVAGDQKGIISNINSMPGALITLAFVLYAAYIFFIATAIIAVRTAVLVFLIVASPLLLLDSVIPKIGDTAMKMRKMFFEQLVVAPVFMIMLALTLKFMEVFQTSGGPLSNSISTATLTGGADSIKTFFSILMMLIMLHIMLKVTKSVSGQAGEYATNFMGKVGGFGLGVATGGAGILARGSIGVAAARMRDAAWMDKLQGSRVGRGLYGLSNSLAQSTFDARNVGVISKGMSSAGMGMGQGTKMTYDEGFKQRDTAIKKKYGSIKDASAREDYLTQKTGGVGAAWLEKQGIKTDAQLTAKDLREGEAKSLATYNKMKDDDRKLEYYNNLPKNLRDRIDAQTNVATISNTARADGGLGTAPLQPGPTSGIAQAPVEPVEGIASAANTTQNGSMPKTKSAPEYAPVTARGKDTAILGQTAAPMSDEELARLSVPPSMRKMGPNDGPQKPTLAESQAAQTEPPLEVSQATLNERDGVDKPGFMVDAVEKINMREVLKNKKAPEAVS